MLSTVKFSSMCVIPIYQLVKHSCNQGKKVILEIRKMNTLNNEAMDE